MPVLGPNHHVGMQRDHAVPTRADVVVVSHQARILAGMQTRYRYRLDPDAAQRQALARAFGCARVVYNDGLRLREDAYKAGLPYPSDGEVQHRVVTLAKQTPERAWLAEVSSVVLVQSVNDLHRAYRNYFRAVKEYKAARARGEQATLKARSPASRPSTTTRRSGSPATAGSGSCQAVGCGCRRSATSRSAGPARCPPSHLRSPSPSTARVATTPRSSSRLPASPSRRSRVPSGSTLACPRSLPSRTASRSPTPAGCGSGRRPCAAPSAT